LEKFLHVFYSPIQAATIQEPATYPRTSHTIQEPFKYLTVSHHRRKNEEASIRKNEIVLVEIIHVAISVALNSSLTCSRYSFSGRHSQRLKIPSTRKKELHTRELRAVAVTLCPSGRCRRTNNRRCSFLHAMPATRNSYLIDNLLITIVLLLLRFTNSTAPLRYLELHTAEE
jgi:hypothetical protein